MPAARLPAWLLIGAGALLLGWSTQSPPRARVMVLAQLGTEKEPVRAPRLLRSEGEARLGYERREGAFERTLRGTELTASRALAADWPAAATDGVLVVEELPDAEQPFSSSVLRNGVLQRQGERVGWCPALAYDAAGGRHLACDTHAEGDYDVVYTDPEGLRTVVAGSARAEFHPSLAVDAAGRVWMAWDETHPQWGRLDRLHRERRVRLVVLDGADWLEVELPAALQGDSAQLAELPRVVADADGPIWLLWRSMQRWPDSGGPARRRLAWSLHASALTGHGWSEPLLLPDSDGGNADALALLPEPGGGVLAAWESDRRIARLEQATQWAHPVSGSSQVVLARLRSEGGAPMPEGSPWQTGRSATPTTLPAGDPDPALVPEGLVRLWGDLHRHTDLSRCAADSDGTVSDQFRYALDVAQLDFLAITDHFQHLTADSWAATRAASQRFDAPGAFSTLFGVERVISSDHRNLITADAEQAALLALVATPEDDPLAGFNARDWVAVPHQIADRARNLWVESDPELDRLVEIFQGHRGGYEGLYGLRRDLRGDRSGVQNYVLGRLRAGRRFGFIASSDHSASLRGFAAVLAKEHSREGIMEALRARRTYAATAPMALDVRLGGLHMGERGRIAADEQLVIRADAGSELARVDVIHNGRLAQSWHGQAEASAAPGARRGVLRVRMGRDETGRTLRFKLEGGRFLTAPRPFLLESDDQVEQLSEQEIELRSRLEAADEDGFTVALEHADGASLVLSSGSGRSRRVALDTLERNELLQFTGIPVELRLDPPPLAARRFAEHWRPETWEAGDWVYVRMLRSDGEAAWSSPFFISEVGAQAGTARD